MQHHLSHFITGNVYFTALLDRNMVNISIWALTDYHAV